MTPTYRRIVTDTAFLLALAGSIRPGLNGTAATYVDAHLILLLFLVGFWLLYKILGIIDADKNTGRRPR